MYNRYILSCWLAQEKPPMTKCQKENEDEDKQVIAPENKTKQKPTKNLTIRKSIRIKKRNV